MRFTGTGFGNSECSRRPSLTRHSNEMSNVLPQFASAPAYGDPSSPPRLPGGTNGNTCQTVHPVSFNQSRKLYASLPRSPIPCGPGKEVGCRRMPHLLCGICFSGSSFWYLAVTLAYQHFSGILPERRQDSTTSFLDRAPWTTASSCLMQFFWGILSSTQFANQNLFPELM